MCNIGIRTNNSGTQCAGGYEQTLHNFDCVCKKLGIPSTTGASYTDTPQMCACNLAFLYILNAVGLSLCVSTKKAQP